MEVTADRTLIVADRLERERRNQSGAKRALKFGKDVFIGGGAATVAKTIVAPVERIKLILQLQAAQTTIKTGQEYRGLVDCFVRIYREQGAASFWRGNWSNILRAASQESLGLAFKEFFRFYTVSVSDHEHNYSKFVAGHILAGSLSGMAMYTITYPLDFTRTRLAADIGRDAQHREFKGLVDCLWKVVRREGISNLYRGILPTMLYGAAYRGLFYGLFDISKVWAVHHGYAKKDLSFGQAFGIGQMTTFTTSMLTYPLDSVRRRLMMDAGKKKYMYKGTIDCARKMLLNEGASSFYSGNFVNLIRGVGAALILSVYNEMSKHL